MRLRGARTRVRRFTRQPKFGLVWRGEGISDLQSAGRGSAESLCIRLKADRLLRMVSLVKERGVAMCSGAVVPQEVFRKGGRERSGVLVC